VEWGSGVVAAWSLLLPLLWSDKFVAFGVGSAAAW
jgi:hypothetical protein